MVIYINCKVKNAVSYLRNNVDYNSMESLLHSSAFTTGSTLANSSLYAT